MRRPSLGLSRHYCGRPHAMDSRLRPAEMRRRSAQAGVRCDDRRARMTGAGEGANRALGLVPVAYDLRGVTDASTWPICRVGSQHVEWFVAPDIIRPERRTPQ